MTIRQSAPDQLREENERLREENERLKGELIRDDLTGLFNARHLRNVLGQRVAASMGDLSLIFLDLDHFKQVNETHGHEAAGRILGQVGRVLMRAIRAEDMAFRYAGDEYVVLVEGGRDLAARVGERIRSLIERHEFVVRGGTRGSAVARVTVSVGVRTLAPDDTAESLLLEADKAMFEAKRRSRNVLVAA